MRAANVVLDAGRLHGLAPAMQLSPEHIAITIEATEDNRSTCRFGITSTTLPAIGQLVVASTRWSQK